MSTKNRADHARRPRVARNLFFSLPIALLAVDASATIYTVGSVRDHCSHTTIQAAIDTAKLNPGPDTIRIARSAPYTQQALKIDTKEALNVVGGFDSCSSTTATGTTTIDGAGGSTEPVFRISISGEIEVTLTGLTISGGDEDGDGYGGGIYFKSPDGALVISQSAINNNLAGYGGGIYAEGTGSNAEIVIGSNVVIANNTARYSGGGIYLDGMKLSMTEPGSILAFNSALGQGGTGGYGGGLRLTGGDKAYATAFIGSNGIAALGAIYGNDAMYGGGIALEANRDHSSFVYLYTTDNKQPLRIRQNTAFKDGGAIYATPLVEFGGPVGGDLGVVYAWDVVIDENSAPTGAAIYLDTDSEFLGPTAGAEFYLNPIAIDRPGGSLPCAAPVLCSRIEANFSDDGFGHATTGAIIHSTDSSMLQLRRARLQGNVGGPLIRADSNHKQYPDEKLTLDDSLVTGNTAQGNLLQISGDSPVRINKTTIASNTITGKFVLSLADDVDLLGSIVHQPKQKVLENSDGSRNIQDIIASEIATLTGGQRLLAVADPRFIDPAHADFHLRADSPAVDYAPTSNGTDLDGNPRGKDLPLVQDRFGWTDLGAFERQSVGNIVLNGNFDQDLRLWSPITAGAATWNASNNIVGATSASGSALVALSNAPFERVVGLSQCVHVPGIGQYRLSGFGLAPGATIFTRDSLSLNWKYRVNDVAGNCGGPADSEGDVFLSSSNTWLSPQIPTIIDAPFYFWKPTTTIEVSLVVTDTGITFLHSVAGYFDGISLVPINE